MRNSACQKFRLFRTAKLENPFSDTMVETKTDPERFAHVRANNPWAAPQPAQAGHLKPLAAAKKQGVLREADDETNTPINGDAIHYDAAWRGNRASTTLW